MKVNGHRESGSSIVASVHAQGAQWRVVIARAWPRVEVLHSGSVAADDAEGVQELMRRYRAERLVRVAPSVETVCRMVALPAGLSVEERTSALAIRTEVDLPGGTPVHRRAGGLPSADASGGWALLVAWLGEGARAIRGDETWCPEIAALSLLAGNASSAAYADRAAGTIAVVGRGPRGATARVLREDSGSQASWTAGVEAAISDTDEVCGSDSMLPVVPDRDQVLLTVGVSLAEIARRVGAPSDEAAWFEAYGIALGAVMALAHEETAALASLRAEAPAGRRSVVRDGLEWLSSPFHARVAAGIALALCLVLPLGASAARKAILEARAERVRAIEPEMRALAAEGALYDQLAISRLPMTRLLSIVARCAPIGVVVDGTQISLAQGLTIQARAESPEVMNEFVSNLTNSGIFASVRTPRSQTGPDGTEFEVTAQIRNPHADFKGDASNDFGEQTLAVRLYGEGASNLKWSGESSVGASSRVSSRSRPTGGASNAGEASGVERTAERPERPEGGATSNEPPPALTDEQIAAMDRSTAQSEWVKRRNALRPPDLDPALKARLEEESQKLMARWRSAEGGS